MCWRCYNILFASVKMTTIQEMSFKLPTLQGMFLLLYLVMGQTLQDTPSNSTTTTNTSTPTPTSSNDSSNKAPETTTTTTTTSTTTNDTILPSDKFTEDDVAELVALKFTRDQVIYELRRFDGDKTQATAALFAKSLTF